MIYNSFYFLNDIIVSFITFLLSYIYLIISPISILFNYYKIKKFDEPNNIIITGACGGLGSNLALRYAKQGQNLSLFGINQENLETLKNKCIDLGANVEINIVDITDKQLLCDKLLDFDSRYSVDLLIANAGLIEAQLSDELSFEEKCQKIIQVNVNGTLNTILPLIPNFKSRQNGQIVIISSLSCYIDHFYPAYSSSKSFCRSFGLTLRNNLSKYGVGVSVVTSGFMKTPMIENIVTDDKCVSMDESCKIIQKGIELNLAQIYFPFKQFLITYSISIASPNFREAVSYLSSFIYKTTKNETKKYK